MWCNFRESSRELAFNIVEQAVIDYKLLLKYGVDRLNLIDEGYITKAEIEDFFRSEWCDFLLCNMKLTGEDILRYLNRE